MQDTADGCKCLAPVHEDLRLFCYLDTAQLAAGIVERCDADILQQCQKMVAEPATIGFRLESLPTQLISCLGHPGHHCSSKRVHHAPSLVRNWAPTILRALICLYRLYAIGGVAIGARDAIMQIGVTARRVVGIQQEPGSVKSQSRLTRWSADTARHTCFLSSLLRHPIGTAMTDWMRNKCYERGEVHFEKKAECHPRMSFLEIRVV